MVAQEYSTSKAVPPWQKQSNGMLSSGATHFLWRYLVSCFLKTVKRGKARYLSFYFGTCKLQKSEIKLFLCVFVVIKWNSSSVLPLVLLLSWSMLKRIWRLKASISAFTRTEKIVVSSQLSLESLLFWNREKMCCWSPDCCLTSVPPSLFF